MSGWQTTIDWNQVWADGARFAYTKATEGDYYTSSRFNAQYTGSYNVGMIRGAYHYAIPNISDGSTQASYFVRNGGGWRSDGRTLPPLLDIEYDPYTSRDGTNSCYGLSQPQMVQWIATFSNTVLKLTGIVPAIYTTTGWWNQCTGASTAFSANPLFIARYPRSISTGPGTLPASWAKYTMWQYADSGTFPGDQDTFNGSWEDLQLLARGGSVAPVPVVPVQPVPVVPVQPVPVVPVQPVPVVPVQPVQPVPVVPVQPVQPVPVVPVQPVPVVPVQPVPVVPA